MLTELLRTAREAQTAGRWDEALEHLERALQQAVREGEAAQVSEVLRRVGNLHTGRGELELANEVFEVSLAVAEAHQLQEKTALVLICIATNEQRCGNLHEAEALHLRALRIAEELEDEHITAMVEHNLGAIANVRGDLEAASGHYRAALRSFERMGNHVASASALNNMGLARRDAAQWEEAEEAFARALALGERLGDAGVIASVQINRAELFLRQHHFARAREVADHAFEIAARLGGGSLRGEVYRLFGMLCRETGKPQQADVHLASARQLAQLSQNRLLEAETLSEWALLHLAEERNREALQCLNGAHRLFAELSARRELLDLDRRLDGLEDTYLRVVQAWGESIESKDRYTAGHCERVANYACMLAETVGITGRDLTWLRMGGYLHDVGKIAVPAEVLNKPGKLTDEEFRLIQSHAAEGDAIVAELNFPWDIRPAVRWHHERWDGSGYPDGLKGEEIPLTARILCVADVYDALTTTRSYRPAMSREQALEIMERDVGRFFDPELFPLFRSLIIRAAPLPDRRFPAFQGEGARTVAG